MRDITHPEQKYIHFWDFMELNDKVHEFQARMGIAMRDLKKEMRQMYKNYYTRAIIQSPEKFLKHNRELQEIEYYTAKRMMGVGGYEIYIELKNKTGDVINGYTYGIKEGESANQVFYVKRLGLVDFNGNITKTILNLGVWS